MGVDIAVLMLMLVLVMLVGIRGIAEQRAVQLDFADVAAGRGGQGDQFQRLAQLCPHLIHARLVGCTAGRVLETHQVHRRAFQFELQAGAVQGCVQLGDAVLVLAEAAVLVFIVGVGGNQGHQGQGEQQGTHGKLQSDYVLLRYNKVDDEIQSVLFDWRHASPVGALGIAGGERTCEFAE
ncbi:hypothetical protein D9M71_674950 [compost metagenome]